MQFYNRYIFICLSVSFLLNLLLFQKSSAFTEQMVALLKAREAEEEKYLMARNESATNSIKTVEFASDLIEKGRINSITANLNVEKLNNDYKQEEMVHREKLTVEKAKAVEQLETDLAIVAQASERLKANAESFVNAGKDAWNNHYEKTEAELREKSDASSNHVQGICLAVISINVWLINIYQ